MIQLPLFNTYDSEWRPPAMDSLPSWKGAKRIGLDTETRSPLLKELGADGGRRKDSYITGISFAIEDGESFYLPIRHQGGDNLPVTQVLTYLRDQAKEFTGEIVGANLPFDLDYLATDGVAFKKVSYFRDIQVAEPLINELELSYSMQSIAKRYGLTGKDETILQGAATDYGINPKADMWVLPARFVGEYAEEDARLPLKILRLQEKKITEQNLQQIFDMESRLLPLIVKMRRRGVRIDLDHLDRIERWSLDEETKALAEIRRLTGIRIDVGDVWRADALVPVLKYLGASIKLTPKSGKPQVDKLAFAALDHPAARMVERARKVNKLRTTFAQSIRNHIVGDRIHCTFNQLKKPKEGDNSADEDTSGAAYGRLSCEHPNLQQQPSRDEFAKMWRAIYLPDEGQLWASNDYSQQEPRMAIHYGSLAKDMIGYEAWQSAIEARDRYRNDPTTDNHQMMADMTGLPRKAAKDIFLGLCYGMGGPKLCRALGLPVIKVVQRIKGWGTAPLDSEEGKLLKSLGGKVFEAAGEEGQKLLDTFDQKVPFIKKLSRACEKIAKSRGYLITLGGRRCRFPIDHNGNYDYTHKALNRLIQGSSADQTKMAMLAIDDAGFDIIIQVHDEIPLGVESEKEAKEAAQIMMDCVPLELPSKVDVEIGKSWGHSMGYEN